jgi:hypothetical protein
MLFPLNAHPHQEALARIDAGEAGAVTASFIERHDGLPAAPMLSGRSQI